MISGGPLAFSAQHAIRSDAGPHPNPVQADHGQGDQHPGRHYVWIVVPHAWTKTTYAEPGPRNHTWQAGLSGRSSLVGEDPALLGRGRITGPVLAARELATTASAAGPIPAGMPHCGKDSPESARNQRQRGLRATPRGPPTWSNAPGSAKATAVLQHHHDRGVAGAAAGGERAGLPLVRHDRVRDQLAPVEVPVEGRVRRYGTSLWSPHQVIQNRSSPRTWPSWPLSGQDDAARGFIVDGAGGDASTGHDFCVERGPVGR
jgi:hypothetical protein